jgi:TolB-like protein/class 3 adenylate cyclase
VEREQVNRRMAAILAADVAGYSRLMGADEEGTLARLKAHRRELVDPKIAEHHGRIVKTTGDGILVEFASVVDAVRCAVAVQGGMVKRNTNVPIDRRIQLRVGINLGDIIIDGDDIHGDGVNVAARLEGLAEPNGVCVSRVVRDQVRDKLDLALEDMGEQQVKNIARPVRVFRIVAPSIGQPTPSPKPALALPDKPSIAVLPFTNLSGDPEQDYFADGIVEDIISALSRVRWLFVIARNSSFTYKGKAVDVKQVGRELGVRYVLEGSVRKASNRVRIAGQLVDATTGAHVWADRFDGALDDIFDLQDRVTASVAGIIEPKLRHAEMERARRKPTGSLDAYDLYLRALAQFIASHDGNLEALRLLRRAVEIDPHYASPYGLAAYCYVVQRTRGWVSSSDPALTEGIRLAKRAASLGQNDPETLWMAGFTLAVLGGDLEGGIAFIDRALTLNPNSADAWRASGLTRAFLGDTELAIAHLERSARLSPLDAFAYLGLVGFAFAHFMAGGYEEASTWCDKTLHEHPEFPPALRMKAATCGLLGQLDEGRAWVERLLAGHPHTTVSSIRLHYGIFMKKPGCLEAILDGLRKAGLPE